MTLSALAEARPRTEGAIPRHPAALAVTSAVLLWFAYPPADRGYLAWVALVPLFLLVGDDRPARGTYRAAWIGGLVFWLLALSWITVADPAAWLGWAALAGFLSLWWPGFILLTRVAMRRGKLPLMAAAPIVWVALEYVRAHLLTGFPWYYLAHSQHRYLPLIQVADLTGAWGLSLVIALANACGADLLSQPLLRPTPRGPRLTRAQVARLAVLGLALAGTLGYGAFRLATARFRPGPRLALLQSDFPQRYKKSQAPDLLLRRFDELIATARRDRPDLIAWPETSFPYGYHAIDPKLDPAAFESQARSFDRRVTGVDLRREANVIRASLDAMVEEVGVPMLIGTKRYNYRPAGYSESNAALLLVPHAEAVQSYEKIHLVPFGEFIPLLETFPWLLRLTPYEGDHIPRLSPGAGPSWFDLNGLRFSVAICFEDTVPHVVRRFFAEARGRQPDLLFNLSNDGWFRGSSEHAAHLANCVFRAVENRAPIARAVNTGMSALIDGDGRVLKSLGAAETGVLVGVAPLDDRNSLYSSWGDWLPLTCMAIVIGLVVLDRGSLWAGWRTSPSLPIPH
jgi:apolipoprotein N-acyltransferase